jgi:integrase
LNALIAKGVIAFTGGTVTGDDGVTDRQREIVVYLKKETNKGKSPTQRSIAAHFGWTSNNAASYHLDTLTRKGLIEVTSNREKDVHLPSTIILTEAGLEAAEAKPIPKVKSERRIVLTGKDLRMGPIAPTEERINRAACVLFTVAAGTRWAETMRAQAEHIDLASGFCSVFSTKTKRKTKGATGFRKVPMLSFTRPLFEKVLAMTEGRKGRLFDAWGGVNHDLPIACAQAGIEKVSPNDLRRTLGNWVAASGADEGLVGDMLGHIDGRMAKRVYGKKRPEQLQKVVNDRLVVGVAEELTIAAAQLVTMEEMLPATA